MFKNLVFQIRSLYQLGFLSGLGECVGSFDSYRTSHCTRTNALCTDSVHNIVRPGGNALHRSHALLYTSLQKPALCSYRWEQQNLTFRAPLFQLQQDTTMTRRFTESSIKYFNYSHISQINEKKKSCLAWDWTRALLFIKQMLWPLLLRREWTEILKLNSVERKNKYVSFNCFNSNILPHQNLILNKVNASWRVALLRLLELTKKFHISRLVLKKKD